MVALFDAAPISEPYRLKIGRTNALRLFKLSQHAAAAAYLDVAR